MTPQILILSRPEAEAFVAGSDDVCISIAPAGELEAEQAQLSANYRAVLRVRFDDVACQLGTQEITIPIATSIADFAYAHRDAKRLVVHCVGGISRSAAVAMAISTTLFRRWVFPAWYTSDMRGERYIKNRHVFDMVAEACRRKAAEP